MDASSTWNNPYPHAEDGANILYSSFSERPKHLDPVRSYSANEYTFIAQIYEPPLQYHFLERPYRLVPLTLTEVPTPVYLDGQGNALSEAKSQHAVFSEYLLRIEAGIHFQPHPAFAQTADGRYRYHDLQSEEIRNIYRLADFAHTGSRELTAQDYIYQIKRLANPRLHSPIGGLMKEVIVGFAEFGDRISTLSEESSDRFLDLRSPEIQGVRAIDRYTFSIRLKGRYPQFLYWLAMPFFAPMPWEADRFYSQPGLIEKNIVLDWYPVGTGAFMLTENNPNRRMVLARNPNFHGESYPSRGEPGDRESGVLDDAGNPLPFIDKAVYNLEREQIPYWNKFLQGYYDSSGISSDSFDQAVQFTAGGEVQLTDAMRAKGIDLGTAVTMSIFYMGFNMLDPVIGGGSERARKLRQALSIAVDFEEYVAIFSNGRGIAAQGLLPPGIFGHVEGERGINPIVYQWTQGRPRRKSIHAARRLLAQAGYPNGRDAVTGEPLILYFDTTASGPDDKARLDWMRKQFAKLKIQLVVRATDYNRFQEKMRKGNAQIFQWGWNADYPDPENFLFLLYGPNARVEHGGENAANYSNPEFDRLFDKMKNMTDGPQRRGIIELMTEILRRDAPWIWGYHPKTFILHHGWYFNSKLNLMANNTLKYSRIDPRLRLEKRREWNKPILWPIPVAALVLVLAAVPAVISYRRRQRSTGL
jgi:ABC-type transport system substrate-binding protein